ncbi:MAG: hypothetical protein JWM63_3656 [Gammaproteobacteria bacterium]|nr:hypothetical protein [Gammaproteobacteria bacterium]
MHSLSEACERNKGPILRVLTETFAQSRVVLEIGSGTGQHAVHFATHLPHLTWQPSDTAEYLAGLREHLALSGPANLRAAIELDVRRQPWPLDPVDALFTANTLHIMGWSAVRDLFRGVATGLSASGTLCIYGPFRYGGRYTSPSNAEFDRFLQARDPESGIRDFASVNALASEAGLELEADHSMPANNQLLVWRRPQAAGQR